MTLELLAKSLEVIRKTKVTTNLEAFIGKELIMSIFNFWKPKQKPFECQPKKDDAFDDANLIYKTVTGIVGMKYRKKNARKSIEFIRTQ